MSARDVVKVASRHLMEKANVVGVGVGEDEKIVVLVSRKLPLEELDEGDVVPSALVDDDYFDFYTDVVEIGELYALYAPGQSISVISDFSTGTLGCFVTKGGKNYLLSNNHVIANCNLAEIGDDIITPGYADQEDEYVSIATLSEFIPIDFSGAYNSSDSGIAELFPGVDFSNELIVGDIHDAVVGDEITKNGRTSGLSHGKVIAVDAVVTVNYGSDNATFSDQIVTTVMLQPGDSGSVGRHFTHPVGLGFAGSDQSSIFTPIRRVLEEYGVVLTTDLDSPSPESPSEPPSLPNKPGCFYGLGLLNKILRR